MFSLRQNILCTVCSRKTTHKLRHRYTESYKLQKSPDGVVVFFLLDILLVLLTGGLYVVWWFFLGGINTSKQYERFYDASCTTCGEVQHDVRRKDR